MIEYIKALDAGDTDREDLNGVPWWDAPIPHRLHRCTVQSRGWINWLTRVERCACGAIRIDGRFGSGWHRKNERRK